MFQGNYILQGTANGRYSLTSPPLREEGKRPLHSYFGFAYKAMDARVRVLFVSGGQKTIIFDDDNTVTNTDWEYFFKDLSEIDVLNGIWQSTSNVLEEWRLVLLFNVRAGGSISIDNIGNYEHKYFKTFIFQFLKVHLLRLYQSFNH